MFDSFFYVVGFRRGRLINSNLIRPQCSRLDVYSGLGTSRTIMEDKRTTLRERGCEWNKPKIVDLHRCRGAWRVKEGRSTRPPHSSCELHLEQPVGQRGLPLLLFLLYEFAVVCICIEIKCPNWPRSRVVNNNTYKLVKKFHKISSF